MYRLALLGIVVGIAAVSCAGPGGVERDGRRYGVTRGVFHGRWWNYYERGCSYLAGGFHKEAEADFTRALNGRGRDAWQARTYGLHFVEYFPNRELGIVFYKDGRLDEAERSLRDSIAAVDTDRAQQYLALVLRAKIAKGMLRDAAAPALTAALAGASPLVTQPEVAIDIDARDVTGVASVLVNGKPLLQGRSAAEVKKQDVLMLAEGAHEIVVESGDLADKMTRETLHVEVDLTGPTVGVFEPLDGLVTQEAAVTLKGVAVDKNGVAAVALDGKALPGAESARMEFTTQLPLQPGENTFVVTAKDRAGNETRTAIRVYQGDSAAPAARLWRLRETNPQALIVAQAGDAPPAVSAAPGAAAPVAVTLKSPSPDRPYRHNKTLCISGEAVAQTRVAALTINGEPLTELTGAPKESFNRRIPLEPALGAGGEATVPVAIVARDDQGREAVRNVDVRVRPVQLDQVESKMPVAVLAFSGTDVDAATAEMLRLVTEKAIVDGNRFRVLDRTRLQDVLNEQQLAAALANPDDAIALGKLTNAHVFLVADVLPREQHGLELMARVVSTETSDIVATLDAFIADPGDAVQVAKACADMAAKLATLFPRLSGELVAVREKPDGAEMLVNWTKEDGVREGAYMLVVEETEPWLDAATGEVLAPGEMAEVARGRIENVMQTGSRARAVRREQESTKIEQGMAAVAM